MDSGQLENRVKHVMRWRITNPYLFVFFGMVLGGTQMSAEWVRPRLLHWLDLYDEHKNSKALTNIVVETLTYMDKKTEKTSPTLLVLGKRKKGEYNWI
ncbi:MAG: hypothetical protein ACTSUE_20365 [Promethearchaeota archaeon]